MDRLRIGVVGCGRMGVRRAKGAAAHPEAELAWVCDVDEARAEALAAELGCPWRRGVEEALAAGPVDAVIVSTPPKWHKPAALAAIEAGKHVFCEKPLARTPQEAREMVEAAERKGVTLKTGSNLRYFPSVRKARELLAGGAVGRLLFLRGWIGDPGDYLGETWFADSEVSGGGSFLDSGSHLLDLSRLILGEARSCVGEVSTSLWPIAPVEDNGFAVFEMEGGRKAFLQASWTEWKGYAYLEVYGSDGFVRVENRGEAARAVLGRRDGREEVFDFSAVPPSSFKDELDDYVAALRSGREPEASGRDGLRAVEMAWGLYEASRSGRRVALGG